MQQNQRQGHSTLRCPVAASVASHPNRQINFIAPFDVGQEQLLGRHLTRKIKSCSTVIEIQNILQRASSSSLNSTHICAALDQLMHMHGHAKHSSRQHGSHGGGDFAMQSRQRQQLASSLALSVVSEPLTRELSPKQVWMVELDKPLWHYAHSHAATYLGESIEVGELYIRLPSFSEAAQSCSIGPLYSSCPRRQYASPICI